MICRLQSTLVVLSALLLAFGCARPEPTSTKMTYPGGPADHRERRSGPAMLFYEAAEQDADLADNVIVIPPPGKKPSAASP